MNGHNASGFDNCIVLNSVHCSCKNLKIFDTSRGLMKLSFRAGCVIENDKEIPT